MREERRERIGVSIKYGCTLLCRRCSGLVVLLVPMSTHSGSYFFRLEDSLSSRFMPKITVESWGAWTRVQSILLKGTG